MKRLTLFLILFLILVPGTQAKELKIGYVDMNRALNECDEGKKAIEILERMVKEKQEMIRKKEEEIRKLEEEISRQSSILNPDALKEKEDERERLMRDYRRMVKDSQDEIEKKRQDFMEKILRQLRETAQQIGKEEGYTIIFEKVASGIIYIPEEFDLTDKLIKRFNEISKEKEAKKHK
jgi:outer membrane protein